MLSLMITCLVEKSTSDANKEIT